VAINTSKLFFWIFAPASKFSFIVFLFFWLASEEEYLKTLKLCFNFSNK